jgi:hypothetical protein
MGAFYELGQFVLGLGGFKLGVWRRVQAASGDGTGEGAGEGVLLGGWSGEVVLPGGLEKALDKTYLAS